MVEEMCDPEQLRARSESRHDELRSREAVRAWVVGEVRDLMGSRNTPSEEMILHIDEPLLSAMGSHFAMQWGDAPFKTRWGSMRLGDVVNEIAAALARQDKYEAPPADEISQAA